MREKSGKVFLWCHHYMSCIVVTPNLSTHFFPPRLFRERETALVEASPEPSWEGRKEVLDSLSEETFTAAPL